MPQADRPLIPRAAVDRIDGLLGVHPVVVLTGARQTGKSTLALQFAERDGRPVFTMDDPDTRARARQDPMGLLAAAPAMVIDEVQREPGLVLALKRAVDAMGPARALGRYLLTGSANLLLMKNVADSLAGRASYITIHPLTRRELLGFGSAGVWSVFVEVPSHQWQEALEADPAPQDDWRRLAQQGGFPVPAYWMDAAARRADWHRGYEATYLERDLRDVSAVQNIPDFRRLLRAAALRIGNLTNQAELARDIQLNQPTVHRYLSLLETTYQIVRLGAFHGNRTTRLIKTPKLYWGDTGAALHLSGETEPRGAHLENMILADLLAWRDAVRGRIEIMYWRTASGREVDFVVEAGSRILGVEVKATRRPTWSDAAVLSQFVQEQGTHAAGVLLHDGEDIAWMADRVLGVPWWKVI